MLHLTLLIKPSLWGSQPLLIFLLLLLLLINYLCIRLLFHLMDSQDSHQFAEKFYPIPWLHLLLIHWWLLNLYLSSSSHSWRLDSPGFFDTIFLIFLYLSGGSFFSFIFWLFPHFLVCKCLSRSSPRIACHSTLSPQAILDFKYSICGLLFPNFHFQPDFFSEFH